MDDPVPCLSAEWQQRLALAFRDGARVPGTAARRVYEVDGIHYRRMTVPTTYRLQRHDFGEIELPTGRIAVAGVPMECHAPAVAARRVAPGAYRVWATTGTSDEDDIEERRKGVFIGVHLSSARIARWERVALIGIDERPYQSNVGCDADLWSEGWYVTILDAARVLSMCEMFDTVTMFDLGDAVRDDTACPDVATIFSPANRGTERMALFAASSPCTLFCALDAAGNPCQFVIDTGFLGVDWPSA